MLDGFIFLDDLMKWAPLDWDTPHPYPYNHYVDEEGNAILEYALAGIPKDRISVEMEDYLLTIKVLKKPNDAPEEKVRRMPHRGISQKAMTVNWSIVGFDSSNITVTYVDGLLRVVIPKSKPNIKTIAIRG